MIHKNLYMLTIAPKLHQDLRTDERAQEIYDIFNELRDKNNVTCVFAKVPTLPAELDILQAQILVGNEHGLLARDLFTSQCFDFSILFTDKKEACMFDIVGKFVETTANPLNIDQLQVFLAAVAKKRANVK